MEEMSRERTTKKRFLKARWWGKGLEEDPERDGLTIQIAIKTLKVVGTAKSFL